MNAEAFQHQPVLLAEVIEYLRPRPGGVYVDGTLGGAGHAGEVLRRIQPAGRLIGIDQDESALAAARKALAPYGEAVVFEHDNFRNIEGVLERSGHPLVDGILLDLGVSSPQLDVAERGFSYMADGPLDMRMDRRAPMTAAELVNSASRGELTRIISEYGEERWASRIAQFIENERKRGPIETTNQLVEVIKAAIPAGARRTGPHPAKRTFQALRIAVNDELGALKEALQVAAGCLAPGGRLVVISFHSLEDRCCKHTFRELAAARPEELAVVTKKPVEPSEDELEQNPRARSAKLRAVERPGIALGRHA